MVDQVRVSGPYVAIAAVCEKVLTDRDGVLSLIRVIDRVIVNARGVQPPEQMPPLTLPLGNYFLVVSLKSGTLRGSHRLEIQMTAPEGASVWDTSIQVLFEGDDDRGINAITPLAFQVQQDGLYWIDVLCDGVLITKVPFRVVYQPMQLRV